ncbi:hypothetical protein [Halospeciosus flavus]|uniref:SPW repeat-containing protein n=1 Tax=Halospeciosus flavus TaxID=3032283 RepID=A0ABD5Z7K7_9EURY|nr:hypothetical protein [Halospeciosus flavus]
MSRDYEGKGPLLLAVVVGTVALVAILGVSTWPSSVPIELVPGIVALLTATLLLWKQFRGTLTTVQAYVLGTVAFLTSGLFTIVGGEGSAGAALAGASILLTSWHWAENRDESSETDEE